MCLALEKHLQVLCQEAFQQLFDLNLPLEAIRLKPTHKEFSGDYTLVTFPLAAACKSIPEQIAQQIGTYLLQKNDLITDFTVVKGFLNFIISDHVWIKQFNEILHTQRFGYASYHGKKVVVEFSSPNTNKPLHLGHLRNNFLGYAVSQILKAAGYEVYQVNLVNDRGIHICKSMVAYERWGKGITPTLAGMKGDHFVGKYYVLFEKAYKQEIAVLQQTLGNEELAKKEASILQAAKFLLRRWEAGDPEVIALWKQMNEWVYEGFADTYQKIGIAFDKTYYESQVYLLGKQVVAEGLEKNIFYKKPDGSVWIDLRSDGLDEKLLLRSDGTAVYMTQDIGVADLRYQDFATDQLIYVVGDEQTYHFEILQKIMRQLGRPYAKGMYHLSYGMVDLPSGKMKSREGTVVDADKLIEEMVATATKHTKELGKIDNFSESSVNELYHTLAMGALKYFLLRVDAKKRLMFDPQASIDFQGDTGPFIQYTYARIAAILRKAKHNISASCYLNTELVSPTSLQSTEREIIKELSKFPTKIQEAAENYAPAIIAQYVLGLAKSYNRLYADLPILYAAHSNEQQWRLQLSSVVAQVLKEAMNLLGIQLPEQM